MWGVKDDKQNKGITTYFYLSNIVILFKGNDFLEDSPYEPVNSRLSDIFRLAPIIGKVLKNPFLRGSHSIFLVLCFIVLFGRLLQSRYG